MSNNIIIPSNPQDQEKIRDAVKEISNSMVREESEKEYQKESIKQLSEDFDIPSKYIRQMVKEFHKNEFDKRVNEFEDYKELYESIIG